MQFPVFDLKISDILTDEAEVSYVALVDKPAIKRDFLAFGNQPQLQFSIQNEDERIISGPLMFAETPIYRNSKQFGEHFIKFSAETIKQIAIKFSKKGYHGNVNIMHSEDMQVDGLVMFESFITDSKRGIMPMKGFEDAPDGSWFGSFYVENDQVWEAVKLGVVKGFSVEGIFNYTIPKKSAEETLRDIAKTLGLPYNQTI